MYNYSHRLSLDIAENSITRRISETRRQGIRLLDLTVSNPTRCLADYPHGAIGEALATSDDFSYDPDPLGLLSAREAVATYYRGHGLQVHADQLLLTASTSEAYGFLFKLLCDPGDEVLAPMPSYPLFEHLAALEAVRIVPYPLRYDGNWHIDFELLEHRISPLTKAIVIVNPNNPTGTYLATHERDQLLALSQRFRLPVISDEVFLDFCFSESRSLVKSLGGNETGLTFSLNGLSKAAGMPQMKLGWMVINGAASEIQRARERMELIADTYLSVNTPVQRALPRLLKIGRGIRRDLAARVSQNLSALAALLEGSAIHRLHADGGWSAILQVPRILTEEQWVLGAMEDKQVLVQPGYFFDMASEAYLVVSLITPHDEFREGIMRLRSYVDQFTQC